MTLGLVLVAMAALVFPASVAVGGGFNGLSLLGFLLCLVALARVTRQAKDGE